MENKLQESRGNKVVIVGGGIAGSLIAKSLQFDADVTLIDPKEYFEISWASQRAAVEPSFAERSLIYHKDYLTKGEIVTSNATNITATQVLTADGRAVPYDFLVIATGHADPSPVTRQERLQQFEAENEKIKGADSIVIVGGGPSGVELAGEIAVDYPQKKVTLVHKGPRLLEFIGTTASRKTLDWMKSKNVEVKLEQTVDLNAVSEANGAERHFLCIGKPVGSKWLKDTPFSDSLDEFGRLKVDDKLRVKGHKNVFAIGDITDVKEMKQGYLAQEHALVTAKNLKLLISGKNECKMATYKPGFGMAIVSLGRKEAVAQFPFATISGTIPGFIKSRDLFVGKARKQLGLNA